MTPELPVSVLRSDFVRALERGPVVLSSPTGSGKSTEVPRWCDGRVLVVEPRRIACRSLATRVAELEDTRLGDGVGYVVRDEHVISAATRIVYVTPGMVLRNRALLATARTVILDEFHERSLELDLLLALLLRSRSLPDTAVVGTRVEPRASTCPALVVMSATLEGERVASHIGGLHLTADGRSFPVEIRYLPGRELLPDLSELSSRVARALVAAENEPGDVLVFLPGKAEIEACAEPLRRTHTVVPLHGGLSLDEQRRAFDKAPRRKVILATNVAETSLTIPGIGVVIDVGLVRQTRYHDGRGSLTLTPIALDSAAQRAGRAGRTAKGVCFRLWNESARLQEVTLPEIHRESLVPLVLTAAAWGEQVEDLRLLDPPKPYALEAARADLAAWGALSEDAALSECGQGLFALPIEPRHARMLVAARAHTALDDMVDLVSVLSVGRPLFIAASARERTGELEDELRLGGCDVTRIVSVLRSNQPAEHGASSFVVREARLVRARLRTLLGLPEQPIRERPIQREAVLTALIAADPRMAHVARVRGRDRFFSNGGTEIELARESAAQHVKDIDAILAVDTRAFGAGRDAKVLVTCAMVVPLSLLARAGLGTERIASVQLDRKRVVATIERVFAKRVLSAREQVPQGELARSALVELLSRGSLFREAIATTRTRLVHHALANWLAARGRPLHERQALSASSPTLEAWLVAKVDSLGVESGDDLALLSASDFLAPELPYESRGTIEDDYPMAVSVGDASYRASYDLAQSQVTLHMIKGTRSEPPTLSFLPKFPGLRICVEGPKGLSVVRARG